MKSFAALAVSLAWGALAAGQCIEVRGPELPETKSSSRSAKIAVLLNGKPQGNVKVVLSLPAGLGLRSLVSGPDGNVMLKDLPDGLSCVTAAADNHLAAVLCLQVSAHSNDEASSFSMVLSPTGPPSNSFGDKVKRAEQSVPSLRLRRLAGTVVDPLGAVIPNADVHVYKRGKYPDGALTILKTNELGRFELSLEPGIYTVIIRMHGFRSEFVEVEISPDGIDSELHKTLQVAVMDNCGVA